MTNPHSATIDAWRARGIVLDPGTIEDPNVYEVVLVLGDRDPATEIDTVKRALETQGFRKLARRAYGKIGAYPKVLGWPGTASTVQSRGDEVVVAYARRAGVPIGGRVPCRLVLALVTTELLGPWVTRGLTRCAAPVAHASGDLVTFHCPDGPDRTFEAVSQALASGGARVIASQEECRQRFIDHMREQIRHAGSDPDRTDMSDVVRAAPREIHLETADGARLEVRGSASEVVVIAG